MHQTRRTRRFIPFLPFLFFGLFFIGGNRPLSIVLSLLASVALTAGISLLLFRRRARHDSGPSAEVFVAPAGAAGLEGVLQIDGAGIHWMPRRASMPLWFIAWGEVVRTAVKDLGAASELQVGLAGADTLTLRVDVSAVDLERALGRARASSSR
jgi:hypothetical protein